MQRFSGFSAGVAIAIGIGIERKSARARRERLNALSAVIPLPRSPRQLTSQRPQWCGSGVPPLFPKPPAPSGGTPLPRFPPWLARHRRVIDPKPLPTPNLPQRVIVVNSAAASTHEVQSPLQTPDALDQRTSMWRKRRAPTLTPTYRVKHLYQPDAHKLTPHARKDESPRKPRRPTNHSPPPSGPRLLHNHSPLPRAPRVPR